MIPYATKEGEEAPENTGRGQLFVLLVHRHWQATGICLFPSHLHTLSDADTTSLYLCSIIYLVIALTLVSQTLSQRGQYPNSEWPDTSISKLHGAHSHDTSKVTLSSPFHGLSQPSVPQILPSGTTIHPVTDFYHSKTTPTSPPILNIIS